MPQERRIFEGPHPYELVALPDRVWRARPRGHHHLATDAWVGRLRLTLTALRPVHVFSGFRELRRDQNREEIIGLLPRGAYEGTTTRVLPGMSLKGAVRGVAEAISPSCVLQADREVRRFLAPQQGPCRRSEALCPACRIFGALGYQGHLQFADVPVAEEAVAPVRLHQLWTPGRRNAMHKYVREGKVLGRKFYRHGQPEAGGELREAVREGQRLTAEMHFWHLGRAELGLVLAALGLDPDHPFALKLGGGKPLGYGSVRVEVQEVTLKQGGGGWRRGGEDLEGEASGRFVRECVLRARQDGWVEEKGLARVAAVLREERLRVGSPGRDPY